ncbi:MAG: hypothetical protein Q9182_002941 [Xanthomendoza sp. 2 TL-2023]
MSPADGFPIANDKPDIMNDPAFDPSHKDKRKKSLDEADTCRICRSEATVNEPLKYPCKCTGSIKFVHQHCLVEWLSHSQKKHCELCKTPFRFTKLYDPNMPATVPTLVFLGQVMTHIWKSLVAWSRLHLVAFVWLCWLPWSMRTVWRGLFWLGDGGWINWAQMQEEALRAAKARVDQLAAEGSSPISRDYFPSAASTASGVISRLVDAFPQMASHTLNLTKGEPVGFGLAKVLFRSFVGGHYDNGTTFIPQVSSTDATQSPSIPYRSSWLSDVGFLRTLTRYPVLNNLFVDTLEGQIITMFIVIAFILIFLIREWVVQQQPMMNLQAGPVLAIEDGIAAAGQPVAPEDEPVEPENDTAHDLMAITAADGETFYCPPDKVLDEQTRRVAEALYPKVKSIQPKLAAAITGMLLEMDITELVSMLEHDDMEKLSIRVNEVFKSWNDYHEAKNHGEGYSSADAHSLEVQVDGHGALESDQSAEAQSNVESNHAGGIPAVSTFQHRPSMPARRTLARAAEIRHIIEDQYRVEGPDWPGLQTFVDLWTRAETEPSRVLRIIEEEGRSEELAWVVAAMKRLENIPVAVGDQLDPHQVVTAEDPTVAPAIVPSEAYTVDNAEQSTLSDKLEGENNPDVQPEDPVSDLATSSAQIPLHSTTQSNNNLSRPDYADHPPPYVQNESTTESPPLPANTETINSNIAEPSPSTRTAGVQATAVKEGMVERIMVWIWGEHRPTTAGNNDEAAADDEIVVQDLRNEPPFIPMEHGQPILEEHQIGNGNVGEQRPAQDPEAVVDAVQAGLDLNNPEAIEEVEDLEGVMELVGMQGPIAGLIQNGMFCAVLVSLTIFLAIWIPYIIGKLFLIILTNPVSLLCKMPLRYAKGLGDFFADTVVLMVTYAYYLMATVVNFLCSPLRQFPPVSYLLHADTVLADIAKGYAEGSATRWANTFIATTGSLSESDIPTFSIIAHESLRLLQQKSSQTGRMFFSLMAAVCTPRFDTGYLCEYLKGSYSYREVATTCMAELGLISATVRAWVDTGLTWLTSLSRVDIFRIDVTIPARSQPLDFTLAYWDTRDRAIAIVFGYLFFALLGVGYLWLTPFFHGKGRGEKVDGILADILYQAAGVQKVILIISVEMIVFPLYCGLLLDVALLPLFGNVTILSRLDFMVNSPYTSLFVHWFVGTCYMFHFALFVSMCRKIMRTGVLYFIRDPDDPTFHPVRDVLERSVFTQLCKIAFSALVYGGLVIVGLGSVVWGISSAFDGVFPIHWSSNEPVLEFPVDLLFYNFLMPLAVKVLKPSKGLTKMYRWWFRVCARGLRLSHFLFDDKREDEEGHHVRRTWRGFFARKRGDTKNPVIGKERQQLAEDQGLDAYFMRDGKYVRTPSSDQVRIPKGAHTFLEVDEAGHRTDGKADDDQGLHGRSNDQFATIYIPPHFRLRISAFIGLLWLFAAATGICFTIIPLVFGRYVFSNIFPSHPRMNDVYAFCIGINVLGGIVFALLNARSILKYLRHSLIPTRESNPSNILRITAHHGVRLLRICYTYGAFGFLLPSLVALVPELYLVAPLHTFFSKGAADHHIIYIMQNWTLGVLYVQMFGRFILWFEGSRPANALRKVCRNGWTNPDVRLATRGFIFPATVLLSLLLLMPLGAGWFINYSITYEAEVAFQSAVYRYTYPAFLALGLAIVVLHHMARAFKGWKRRIRDEVYLIGERLHNFGERKTPAVVGGNRVAM